MTAGEERASTTFAADLRAWREAMGFSRAQAADALSVPKRTYEKWEMGERSPRDGHETLMRRMMSLYLDESRNS